MQLCSVFSTSSVNVLSYFHNLKNRGKKSKQAQMKFILPLFLMTYCAFLSLPISSVQFSSVAQLCLTLCDPMDCSTPGFSVHHQLPGPAQTHVHQVSDAIQPACPLTFPSPPTFNLSQHQGLFQWVNSSHQVAKILEFQPQHQSFQWIFKTDFL